MPGVVPDAAEIYVPEDLRAAIEERDGASTPTAAPR